MNITKDQTTDFPLYYIKPDTKKTEARKIASDVVRWITYQKGTGATGSIIFDIDDTLIDGKERVSGGFEFMVSICKSSQAFPCTHRHCR